MRVTIYDTPLTRMQRGRVRQESCTAGSTRQAVHACDGPPDHNGLGRSLSQLRGVAADTSHASVQVWQG